MAVILLNKDAGTASGTLGYAYNASGYSGQIYLAGYPGETPRVAVRPRARGSPTSPGAREAGRAPALRAANPHVRIGARLHETPWLKHSKTPEPKPPKPPQGEFFKLKGKCVIDDTDGTDAQMDMKTPTQVRPSGEISGDLWGDLGRSGEIRGDDLGSARGAARCGGGVVALARCEVCARSPGATPPPPPLPPPIPSKPPTAPQSRETPRHPLAPQDTCLTACAIAERGQSGQPAFVESGANWVVRGVLSHGPPTGECRGYGEARAAACKAPRGRASGRECRARRRPGKKPRSWLLRSPLSHLSPPHPPTCSPQTPTQRWTPCTTSSWTRCVDRGLTRV